MKRYLNIKLIFILFQILAFFESKDYTIEIIGTDFKILSLNDENELSNIIINYLSELPIYTKLEIIGKEDINYVLSVFSDYQRENRIQLAQSVYRNSTLFLTQNQIQSNQIHADIECSSYPCSYDLIISFDEKINLKEGEQLYYYVTEKNKEMKFLINLNSEKVNIWTLGGKSVKNTIDSEIKSKDGNHFFIENKEKVEFILTGNIGDFINVGSIGYTEDKSNKIIFPDEEVLTVFLQKEVFSKACFGFGMREQTSNNNLVFLEGIIFNKFLKIILKKNGEEINNEILYAKFSKEFMSKDLLESELCFTFPKEEKYNKIKEIKFSFYITSGKNSKKGLNFYLPQFNGQVYSRTLRTNEMIGFIGLKPENNFFEINYNIFSEIGTTKMYIYDCDNYPLCLNNNQTLNVISPRNIDQFSTYSIYKNELKFEYNPISKKQKIMIAYCVPYIQTFDLYCTFDTLIYSDKDEINMNENQYFNQYLLENEIDIYKICISGESNIKQVIIDIIVYVGEVEIETYSMEGIEISKHNSANKFFINLNLIKNSEIIDDIKFKIIAKKNSYYTILYYYKRKDEDLNINVLHSGMNYLVTIDPLIEIKNENANKFLNIVNDYFDNFRTFIVNFYSLNCQLEILKKIKIEEEEKYLKVDKFDYCYEDIISRWDEDGRGTDSSYDYKLKIIEEDFSSYNGKLCMIYVSSVNINEKYEVFGGDIVIPDNTPQQIMFKKKVRHITFGYVHVNKNEDLIAKFNLIHKGEYIIKFFYEYVEGKQYILNSNDVIFLNHSEWKNICNIEGELCYITIDITLNSTKDIEEPILELGIKSVNGDTPIYLPKNLLKLDYIQNNAIQHYFTKVGINEKGFILVNFYRSSARLFAKLEEINPLDEKFDSFPKNKEESLPYDSFTRKIHFNTNEKKCQYGCYLLISIQSNSESSSLQQFRNYPFSIIVESTQIQTSKEIQPMRIPIDEYIIGDIEATENKINDYYSVWLSRDANKVIIDLQSNAANLFINIGNEKPNLSQSDFKIISEGKDIIYTITKEKILEKIGNKDNIKDIFLTIGVWSDINDSVNSTIYSFMIHLEDETQNIIHRVKSDRKTLCDTTEIYNSDSKYSHRCLFVIEYFFIGEFNNLLIYPTLQDKTSTYKIYGEYIEPSKFELGLYSIEDIIPNENSQFSTDKTNLNYLYIPNGLSEGKYLILSIFSNKKTRVELISTFYTYLDLITPNPNTPQLFLVKKEKSLILDFPHDNSLMANFISITGNAEIYWQEMPDNKNYLLQEDYRTSLTSIKNKNRKLIVKSTNKYSDNDIGFAFYLTYSARYEHNFDELILGKSTNFDYSESDFPIVLYSRLENIEKDVEISFTFNILDKNLKDDFYDESPFKASAILVKQKTIYNLKSNSAITIDLSKSAKFLYDPALKTGFVRLRKQQLANFNINQNENPNLYIKLEKVNSNELFKRINVEVSANQENILVPISEKIYQHGILLEDENQKHYILKTVINRPILILEFSSSNDQLSIKLENELGDIIEKQKQKTSNGKNIIIFNINPEKNHFVKLIIFNNSPTKSSYMYTFKYINEIDIQSFIEYIIEDEKINIESKKKNNYKIELVPIKDYKKYNINYLAIICNSKNKSVPKQSITIDTCDKQLFKEFKDPIPNNGKIIFEFNNVAIVPTYFKVIAQIYNNGINEFISYKNYEYKESDFIYDDSNKDIKDNKDDSRKYIILIIILVIFFLIIIGLIIALFIFKRKNKNLLEEVNKTSFVDNENFIKELNNII